MDSTIGEQINLATRYLADRIPPELAKTSVAIVCGSGLNGLERVLASEPQLSVRYADIPGFPTSTVQGHHGRLVFGLRAGSNQRLVLMVGRVHFYEGHSMQDVILPVRVLRSLGAQSFIVTNAAGSLNPDFHVGDLVLLSDHLNIAGFAGFHPLRGPNLENLGPRFLALSDAYDLPLRVCARNVWRQQFEGRKAGRTQLSEGVYAFVSGPSYETRAECRALRLLGADLVGMSTVPEVMAARHMGMRVLAMSLITNCAVVDAAPSSDDLSLATMTAQELQKMIEAGRANHEEVLHAGQNAVDVVEAFMTAFLEQIE